VKEIAAYWGSPSGRTIYRILESSQRAWYASDTTGWHEDRRILSHVGISFEPLPLSRAEARDRLRKMGACPDSLDRAP
jgi:hypothetical protein